MRNCARFILLLTIVSVSGFAQTLPIFKHVFIVVEENANYSTIVGKATMPYLNSLATKYGLALQYDANTYPSLPNYFMLTTGQIITNDIADKLRRVNGTPIGSSDEIMVTTMVHDQAARLRSYELLARAFNEAYFRRAPAQEHIGLEKPGELAWPRTRDARQLTGADGPAEEGCQSRCSRLRSALISAAVW